MMIDPFFTKFRVGQLIDASKVSGIKEDYGIIFNLTEENIKMYFAKNCENHRLEIWNKEGEQHLIKDLKIIFK